MKHLISILALFAVPLTVVAVNAGAKEDREAIRALFHQEQEGHRLGNEKMVRSAHWDDFYIVRTPRKNGVPRYMLSEIHLGEDYLGGFKYKPFNPEEGRQFTSEVNHISINGEVALAITQFRYWGISDDGGRFDRGWQTMWVAEKRNGVWKWKSAIGGFEGYQESSPAPPTKEGEATEEAE